MNTMYTKIVVGVVVVAGLAGGGIALAEHNHSTNVHNAMMHDAAMKKADEAKAMKKEADAAAMKKAEAAKASSSDDAMMHDDTTNSANQ